MKCINLLFIFCLYLSFINCSNDIPPKETPRSRINLILTDDNGEDWIDKLEIGSSGAVLSRHTLTVYYNGGEAMHGKTLYVVTDQKTSRKSLLLEAKDEVWDICAKADRGSVLFSINLPTLFPNDPSIRIYWEWRAENVERGRSIVEYKNATVNGQSIEISAYNQIFFEIPK